MRSMQDLSKYIQQIASPRLLMILTVVMFGLGYAITSSISPSAELMALAHGKNVPDAQFWRTADDLYQQLTEYGSTGIHLYLTRISPIDLFIPIAQALVLSVAITLIFRDTLSRLPVSD